MWTVGYYMSSEKVALLYAGNNEPVSNNREEIEFVKLGSSTAIDTHQISSGIKSLAYRA